MLKINFNTPFPHNQRDTVLHAMRDLGFKYERIIQNGEYSLFRLTGVLPDQGKQTNIDIIIGDNDDIDTFKQLLVRNVEIYFLFERS